MVSFDLVPLFAVVGIFGDIITTLSGEYNYFNPQLIPFIDHKEIIRKFMAFNTNGDWLCIIKWFLRREIFLLELTDFSQEK